MNAHAGRGRAAAILIAASVGAFLLTVSVFWIGFLGSDDGLYWEAAGGWLAHVPWLGANHWALRHTLVIPMAIARAILGDGFGALLLPSLLYAIGVVVVIAIWVHRAAGIQAAAVAMALVVTNPRFVLLSSVANIDVVEIFFIVSAFALIHGAMDPALTRSPSRIRRLLLLAGASLGMAMLSRETSAFAVVAIGLLFLAGYGMRRARYFLIGIGFAAVTGLEFVYLWWMSGNLFYRLNIALNHDSLTNRWLEQGASVPLVHPAIDPLTMLLLNHNFGLLAWIGVPLVVWSTRRDAITASTRRLEVLALVLAVTWTVFAAGSWTVLDLVPRYFLLPALLVSMLSGIALTLLWRNGRRRLAGGLGVLLIGANLFALSIDNRNFMYGEHILVDLAARPSGPIHTDPRTSRRADLLLEWQGTFARVTTSPAGPGDLYYLDPARDDTKPGSDWTVVERHGLPPTIGQWLVSHLLPAGTLSPALFDKLGRGHPDVTLYRLP